MQLESECATGRNSRSGTEEKTAEQRIRSPAKRVRLGVNYVSTVTQGASFLESAHARRNAIRVLLRDNIFYKAMLSRPPFNCKRRRVPPCALERDTPRLKRQKTGPSPWATGDDMRQFDDYEAGRRFFCSEASRHLEDIIDEIDAANEHGDTGRDSGGTEAYDHTQCAHENVKPSVEAVLLEDGRCAVRIVRRSGAVQAVIIDPPAV